MPLSTVWEEGLTSVVSEADALDAMLDEASIVLEPSTPALVVVVEAPEVT